MLWIIELIVIAIIIRYFIKWERPKKRFLIYGIIFSIISFILTIPFKIFLHWFQTNIELNGTLIASSAIILLLTIIVTELTRYFSLNRYLMTKSYKNGILFGMGWAIFDLIIVLQQFVLTYITTYASSYSIDIGAYSDVIVQGIDIKFFGFATLVIIALAQTTLIVLSVIKEQKRYIYLSIIYGFLVLFPINDFNFLGYMIIYKYVHMGLLVLGLYITFNYRRFS